MRALWSPARKRRIRISTRVRFVAAFLFGTPLHPQSLTNGILRADFGPRGLIALTDSDGYRYRFQQDGFSITIGDQTIDSRALAPPSRTREPGRVSYRYTAADVTLQVEYELRTGWHFLSKQLVVSATHLTAFHIRDLTPIRGTLVETPASVYLPPSARPSLETGVYGAALRFDQRHSLLTVVQNPFLQFTHDAATFALRYPAEMDWQKAYGPFASDRALIAPVRLTGRRLPASMIPEWRTATTADAAGLDEAEVAAFTGMVHAFLLYHPTQPINVLVGWCANDYQIDVGTPAGRAEYKHLFDQAASLGAQYVLYAPSNSALSRREQSVDDWSWEHVLWLGLGQQIRQGEWDPESGATPPSIQEMLDYARGKGLRLLAYVYPVMPFTRNPEWLVPAGSGSTRRMASLGNRALQDWLIHELVAFHDRTGIAGYSFDHTFLTFQGTSRYAQWWGWRRVMEELRRRIPDIVIDGRQQYHLYGPWSWLAGSYPHPTFNDEQPESFVPYPDLHFDRVSADRERYTAYRYRNYEFAPSEIVPGFMTHQTSRSDDSGDMPSVPTADRGTVLTSFRTRDWDYLGWRYSVLSSIAVAGWNNVLNMIPARDSAERANVAEADRAWLRRWLDWTVANREYLRHTRTILGQPAFGKVDGTSAIVGEHGFVFLFNPDARRHDARFTLDVAIGLADGERYVLRELYPLEGRLIGKPLAGIWRHGDSAEVSLDGGSALVLEITPAAAIVREPLLFNAPGTVSLDHGLLDLRDVEGEPGTTVRLLVLLPQSATVSRARVNGRAVPVGSRAGDTMQLDVRFDGTEFHRLQPALVPDPAFAGGRLNGTFTIPRRIFDQLAARRRAWPIPWTADDYRTTWLVPERLLLFVQFAEPDDAWEARLTIDGRPVELHKAYTAVRRAARTFVGFYADLSLLDADRQYQFGLELPAAASGRFRGLFFENVEPEFTTALAPVR